MGKESGHKSSIAFLHIVGKEFGHKSSAATVERVKMLQEVVMVLKPSGMTTIWDLVYVPNYVQMLNELRRCSKKW